MGLFMQGDIFGLEDMKKQVIETGNSDYSDILNLLDLIINMNYILIETENNLYADKYNNDLYVLNNDFSKIYEHINYIKEYV